jgi:hypothetical protein
MRARSSWRGTHRAPWLAWSVLAGALASALGLVGVAFSAVGGAGAAPALAGEATLARLAGEVADGVVDEWERMRREANALEGIERFVWSVAEPVEPRGPLDSALIENDVLDALLAESVRLEVDERDPERAALVVADAAKHVTDPVRAARLALRKIQLARGRRDDELVRTTWRAATSELDPALALGETSALLVLTLAAGPALEIVERARVRDRLSGLWTRGELPLPRENAGELPGSLRQPAPIAAELRRRLQGLVPEAGDDRRLVRIELEERARVLRAAFGSVPAPEDDLELLIAGEHELLFRATLEGDAEGVLLVAGTTRARLEARLDERALLPPDFALDFACTDTTLGSCPRPAR